MAQITVGQISAGINAGIIIVQITLPLAIVLVLVGVLSNKSNAVTWSVVDYMFQRSLWPTLLRSDSTASKGVLRRVSAFSYISFLGTILLLATSVLTPLGLSDEIQGRQLRNPQFEYVPDTSWFGRGTAPRAGYSLSRLCGSFTQQICPGQTDTGGLTTSENGTNWIVDTGVNNTGWIDSKIPQNITEIFTSADGMYGPAVANIFDIQYRNYQIIVNNNSSIMNIDNGQPYVEGQIRFLESLVLNNQYDVVEGLVVDTKKGGIGFRNHTMPVNIPYGASWEETLLWMEPSTICVNNNLTVDYTIDGLASYSNVRLTNHGGFMNPATQAAPPPLNRDISQAEPGLQARAYKGAFYSNLAYSRSLNLSLRHLTGTTYNIASDNDLYSDFVPSGLSPWEIGRMSLGLLPNDTEAFDIDILCSGFGGRDSANITNISVRCGTIIGAAARTDSHSNDRDFMFESGSTWERPIYTCATAVKSSLKRISFLANGTAGLKSLEVVAINDTTYSGNTSQPIWAVEKTGMPISEVNPIWGLVDEKHENHKNLWTIRSSHLYLPAGASGSGAFADDSLAGTGFYQGALSEIYDESGSFDYSGKESYAMSTRWKELSKSADTVSAIPNLIWTDIMANSVVGSRSIIDNRRNLTDAALEIPEITIFKRLIVYNAVYAIPAITLLSLWVIVCLSAFVVWVSSRVTLPALRQLLNQTATGRAVANIVYPNEEASNAPTSQWVKDSGMKVIGLTNLGGSMRSSTSQESGNESNVNLFGLHFTSEPEDKPVRAILEPATSK